MVDHVRLQGETAHQQSSAPLRQQGLSEFHKHQGARTRELAELIRSTQNDLCRTTLTKNTNNDDSKLKHVQWKDQLTVT
jgi:hypothetical protein